MYFSVMTASHTKKEVVANHLWPFYHSQLWTVDDVKYNAVQSNVSEVFGE